VRNAQADDWIFALISVQTQDGFIGRGNYGVARMNSGSGSRSYVHLVPEGGFGSSLLRDIRRLVSEDYDSVPPDFIGSHSRQPLVWTTPWDGATQLSVEALEPLFVEICRRLRLETGADGQIFCRKASSSAQRIRSKELCGVVGDPWSPVDVTDDPKVLTLAGDGFTYAKCAEILFENASARRQYQKPYLLRRGPAENGDMIFLARALMRGQSKTEGYHSRALPVPGKVLAYMDDNPDEVAALARERIEFTGNVWSKVLRSALMVLAQSGREHINWRDDASGRFAEARHARFDALVDARFFPELWDAIGKPQAEARRNWALALRDVARQVFDESVADFSVLGDRSFLAEARARSALEGGLYKQLPDLRGSAVESAS
jgi:CRISPR system Cascade subunit CasA